MHGKGCACHHAGVAAQSKLMQAPHAHLRRCAEGDLAKERGAVLEEWRMSRDAVGRAQEAHWRLIMQGSK